MIIYACDSTAQTASVALCRNEVLLAQYTQNNGNTHSETLLPMTETMLKANNTDIDDVDMFACSAGPGSFTGVRIGTATIKGLAYGKNKPCVGVSTLEALAMNLVCDEGERLICPVMDARRGQVYTAMFICRDGKLERLTPDRAVSFEEFASDALKYGMKLWLCGDGYPLVKAQLPADAAYETPELLRYQSAYSVAQAALTAYRRGDFTTDRELRPVYLRLSQAERERLAAGRSSSDKE